jgi:TetR/AcrR family transcriptional regulator, regulator of cefoperazone and chloramphenicol sensitivity
MDKPHKEAKEKLLQATLAILDEGTDPEQITTRDITKRAGMNIALINYHFQSKDNLIEQAVLVKMAVIVNEMYEPQNFSANPVEKLRSMLKKNAELVLHYYSLMKKGLSFELKNGSYFTVQTILPILKEIFEDRKTEQEIRLIALQLLVPLQTMSIYPEIYQKNLDTNMFDIVVLNHIIDTLIDNLLPKHC